MVVSKSLSWQILLHTAFQVYNEVLLGCQLGQVVEWWKNQCFEDHLCHLIILLSTLRTRTEVVLKTLVFSSFNHLTWLIAWENFIIFSYQESTRSYSFPSSFLLLHIFASSHTTPGCYAGLFLWPLLSTALVMRVTYSTWHDILIMSCKDGATFHYLC